MKSPTKTKRAAFARCNSKVNSLPDYAPLEGTSEEEPTRQRAPRIQGVHKPMNSLKGNNLPSNTQRAPFDFHGNRSRRGHLDKRQESDGKSENSKVSSTNVINLKDFEISPSPNIHARASTRPTRQPKPSQAYRSSPSDHASEPMKDVIEQTASSYESRPPSKRKFQHPIDVIDSSGDELALTHKQPKITIQDRPNKNQGRCSNTRKTQTKSAKQGLATKTYPISSIFSETHYWSRPQPRGYWLLHQDQSNGAISIFDEYGDPIQELVFKPQIIQKIQQSPRSEKLVIHKHKDVTAKGSTKVFLELIAIDDVRQICNVLEEHDSTISFVAIEEAQLDQTFIHNRKMIESMHPNKSQLQIKSKIRNTEVEPLLTMAMQGQGQGPKNIKQHLTSVDVCRKADQKDGHDRSALGERKRHEHVTPSATKGTTGGPQNIDSSNSSNNDSLLVLVEASSSIDPDSFYGSRTRSSSNRLTNREPTARERSSSPVRWTEVNPHWAQAWKGPIIYPRQGDKRSKAIVEKTDIERLDDGQFLNDNLINFYLCWLEHHLTQETPVLGQRIYFHNTFFYKCLTKPAKGKRGINYEAVDRWTSKIDLLSFDYIIVPVNEHDHWYLAIICNAPKLQGLQPEVLPSLQSQDEIGRSENLRDCEDMVKPPHPASQLSPSALVTAQERNTSCGQKAGYGLENKCEGDWSEGYSELKELSLSTDLRGKSADIRIVEPTGAIASNSQISHTDNSPLVVKDERKSRAHRTFDPRQPRIITLDSLGLKHSPTCTNLKNYLIAEVKAKKNIDIPPLKSLGMTAVNIPQQTNYVDCGAFLLSYVEQFIKRPDEFICDVMQAQDFQAKFQTASSMRGHIRQILLKLQEEQADEC